MDVKLPPGLATGRDVVRKVLCLIAPTLLGARSDLVLNASAPKAKSVSSIQKKRKRGDISGLCLACQSGGKREKERLHERSNAQEVNTIQLS